MAAMGPIRPACRLWVFAGLSLAAGSAACNLLAGIHEGTLAEARADATAKAEAGGGGKQDAGVDASASADAAVDVTTRRDTGAGRDGGSDVHPSSGDARPPDAHERDALPDQGGADAASGPFACAVSTAPRLLASLAGMDAGSTFGGAAVFVAPTTVAKEFYVVAQPESDGSGFSVYEVTAGQGVATQTMNGLATAGIGLLDLLFARSGANVSIQVLTNYAAGVTGFGSLTALQVVPLAPSFTFASAPSAYRVSARSPSVYAQAWLSATVSGDAGEAAWLAVTGSTAIVRNSVVMGEGPGLDAGPVSVAFDAGVSLATIARPPFFAAASRYHVLLPGPAAEAGILEFSAPANLGAVTAAGAILPPPEGAWTLLGSKASAGSSARAVVLLEATGPMGNLTAYGAVVPAGKLAGLTIGDGGLHQGTRFPAANGATQALSSGWYDDDLVTAGSPSQSHGISLVWLGPDGTLRGRSATPLFVDANDVVSSAVQFESYDPVLGSTFDVAWIESVSSGGVGYQELYAAQAFCGPGVDGGT
jgi:hypothetical protein